VSKQLSDLLKNCVFAVFIAKETDFGFISIVDAATQWSDLHVTLGHAECTQPKFSSFHSLVVCLVLLCFQCFCLLFKFNDYILIINSFLK
jgi:hypothetical protein